jgi:hypothetical protein
MLLKCAQITIELHSILNFLPATACIRQFLPEKHTFYGKVSKSIVCVALVCKAADKIRITIFSNSSE